jgi:hypothetical protein
MSRENDELRRSLLELLAGQKVVDVELDASGLNTGTLTLTMSNNVELKIGSTPNVEKDSILTFCTIEKVEKPII